MTASLSMSAILPAEAYSGSSSVLKHVCDVGSLLLSGPVWGETRSVVVVGGGGVVCVMMVGGSPWGARGF